MKIENIILVALFSFIQFSGMSQIIYEGTHDEGFKTFQLDNGEIIGAALRTKRNVRPVYASIGHKIDLAMAVHQVLACCSGYRLPEPTRIAHLAAGGDLKPKIIRTHLAESGKK